MNNHETMSARKAAAKIHALASVCYSHRIPAEQDIILFEPIIAESIDSDTADLRRQLEASGEAYNHLESVSNAQVVELDRLREELRSLRTRLAALEAKWREELARNEALPDVYRPEQSRGYDYARKDHANELKAAIENQCNE